MLPTALVLAMISTRLIRGGMKVRPSFSTLSLDPTEVALSASRNLLIS